MVKINLLPHREQQRKKRQQRFYAQLVMTTIMAGGLVFGISFLIHTRTEHQNMVNQLISNENQKLDAQVREVASLTQEIDALKARQRAVENLQNDRNQSIYLLDELSSQVPEGIYLYELRQEEKNVTLRGFAQSNEHVSEFMRNIENHARWTENPQLQEIRATYRPRSNNTNQVFDFTLTIAMKNIVLHDSGYDMPEMESQTDDALSDSGDENAEDGRLDEDTQQEAPDHTRTTPDTGNDKAGKPPVSDQKAAPAEEPGLEDIISMLPQHYLEQDRP